MPPSLKHAIAASSGQPGRHHRIALAVEARYRTTEAAMPVAQHCRILEHTIAASSKQPGLRRSIATVVEAQHRSIATIVRSTPSHQSPWPSKHAFIATSRPLKHSTGVRNMSLRHRCGRRSMPSRHRCSRPREFEACRRVNSTVVAACLVASPRPTKHAVATSPKQPRCRRNITTAVEAHHGRSKHVVAPSPGPSAQLVASPQPLTQSGVAKTIVQRRSTAPRPHSDARSSQTTLAASSSRLTIRQSSYTEATLPLVFEAARVTTAAVVISLQS